MGREIKVNIDEVGGPPMSRPGYLHQVKITVPQARQAVEACSYRLERLEAGTMSGDDKRRTRLLRIVIRRLKWAVESAELR